MRVLKIHQAEEKISRKINLVNRTSKIWQVCPRSSITTWKKKKMLSFSTQKTLRMASILGFQNGLPKIESTDFST